MTRSAIDTVLAGSRSQFLLLDSNLLVLWITAKYDLSLLATFKRVQMFTQDDAIVLAWIVDQFKAVATTAHVVTEASNLGNSLSARSRVGWFSFLSEFSATAREETRSLGLLTSYEEFVRFGVTDCALSVLPDTYRVLTTDYRLSNHARRVGKPILNFDELQRML